MNLLIFEIVDYHLGENLGNPFIQLPVFVFPRDEESGFDLEKENFVTSMKSSVCVEILADVIEGIEEDRD